MLFTFPLCKARLWLLGLPALLCVACGGAGNGEIPTLERIDLVPANTVIASGSRLQLSATGIYSNRRTQDVSTQAAWTSSDNSVVRVNATGLADAISPGSALLTVRLDDVSASTSLTVAAPMAGAPSVWTFSNPTQALVPERGDAELQFHDPQASGWGSQKTRFAKASVLGLPLMNGEDPDVMAFPATTAAEGYLLTHRRSPNGVFADDGFVSNYTLVMDVLWPAEGSASFRSLFQTDLQNTDDADMFVADVAGDALGLGVNGRYNNYAAMTSDRWYRIVVSVQCALGSGGTGQIRKYVDGLFVGGQYTPGQGAEASRCRWALDPALLLFTDNDGETGAGYVSSILFIDRLLTPEEILQLGRARAAGADVPGPAAAEPPQRATRRVEIFGHRTQGGFVPENTLAGIDQAFSAGADHIEADVRISSDGTLILLHDETVDRTTDGSGLASSLSLATLRGLDAGSWFDPAYAGAQVPTLTEALMAANGRGRLLLDVRVTNQGAAIREAVDAAGVAQNMIWLAQNDSRSAAADFQANLPDAPLLWGVVPDNTDAETFDELKALGVVGFEVDYETVSPEFIRAAQESDMRIIVFTVLDPDTMLRMIDWGVDAIETDYPAVLNSLMPAIR